MNSASEYRAKLLSQFDDAMGKGFVTFPYGVEASNPINSTPFFADVRAFHSFSHVSERRKKLVSSLTKFLVELQLNGLKPLTFMVGGSFLDFSVSNPRDLDCVIFYQQCESSVIGNTEWISNTRRIAKVEDLDVRLVPTDGDLIVLLRSVIYFSALYGASKNGKTSRGTILIDCQ